jgi:hypothetical protein
MDRFIDQRYLFEECILSTDKGVLYQGRDLLLRRNVFLYMVKPKGNTSPEEHMKMMAGVSFLQDSNFFHILDVGLNSEGVYAVLEAREGKPLTHIVCQHSWSASICITLVLTIGNTVQDALQKRVRGFSVTIDNIWITPHNEPIIINNWSEGDRLDRGVAGLGALLFQLLTRQTEAIPSDSIEVRRHIEVIADVPAEQIEAISQLLSHSIQLQTKRPLPSFLYSLHNLCNEFTKSCAQK